jgi:single-stranded-DNA-specific exonuclease
MGQAKDAVELLITNDVDRAKRIASAMEKANQERRSTESHVLETCLYTLEKNKSLLLEPAIALFGEKFHIGVMGIVAQRLVERYHRPAAVMAPATAVVRGSVVPVVKGSVRSIPGFSVAEVLHELKPILLSGGGHSLAGGFTLLPEQLEAFQEAFVEAARLRLSEELLQRSWKIDTEVKLSEVDFRLATELQALAPFGVGNPSPLLVSREVVVDSVTTLSERDLKLRFSAHGYALTGVAWKLRGHPHLVKGNKVSIAFSPELNSYQGISSVQLNVKEAWK